MHVDDSGWEEAKGEFTKSSYEVIQTNTKYWCISPLGSSKNLGF